MLTALPHMTAVLLQGALRAEGIAVELEHDGLAAVYGLHGGGFSTSVLVPTAEVARAQRVVTELESAV